MSTIAFLPHPLEGIHADHGKVRVLALTTFEGESGSDDFWLIVMPDGTPKWVDFENIKLSERLADL